MQLPAAKFHCGKSHNSETAFQQPESQVYQQHSLLHDKVNSTGTTSKISVGCSYWLEINDMHVNKVPASFVLV